MQDSRFTVSRRQQNVVLKSLSLGFIGVKLLNVGVKLLNVPTAIGIYVSAGVNYCFPACAKPVLNTSEVIPVIIIYVLLGG